MSANYNPIILKKYTQSRGTVYVIQNQDKYSVEVMEHNGDWGTTARKRVFDDSVDAQEFYETAKKFVEGKCNWSEPKPARNCKYDCTNIKECNAKNCISELGGDAYWRFFRASCPYKVR